MVIDEIDTITNKNQPSERSKKHYNICKVKSTIKRLVTFKTIKTIFGEDEYYYDLIIQYYARKEMVNELLQTIEDAYKTYPYNYQLMKIKAILSIEMEKNYKNAISYYKKYTKIQFLLSFIQFGFILPSRATISCVGKRSYVNE